MDFASSLNSRMTAMLDTSLRCGARLVLSTKDGNWNTFSWCGLLSSKKLRRLSDKDFTAVDEDLRMQFDSYTSGWMRTFATKYEERYACWEIPYDPEFIITLSTTSAIERNLDHDDALEASQFDHRISSPSTNPSASAATMEAELPTNPTPSVQGESPPELRGQVTNTDLLDLPVLHASESSAQHGLRDGAHDPTLALSPRWTSLCQLEFSHGG
jgi:hypothetical protein